MSGRVNLVVFIDGTGNNDFKKPVEEQTNVARLWHACETASSPDVRQSVYYKPGVGTRRGEALGGSAAGICLTDRVNEALQWLTREVRIARADGFEPRVYLYGFSRGAYAVRCLAQLFGGEVEVLGVWDTVKTTLKGPDVDVAPKTVLHAFHALAIDEHRSLFDVTHFKDSPQAVEVWFPGSHSDVGGGYEEAELSYAPLNWMVEMSVRHGLLVDMSRIPPEPHFESAMPVVHDETESLGWGLANLFGGGRFDRSVAVTDFVHPTVVQLRGLGYSPQFLPADCVVWSADGSVSNVA